MNKFFSSLLLWALIIISCGLFYTAATVAFANAFVNIAMAVSAIFLFVQALGIIDKRHHFGEDDHDSKEKS